MKTKAILFFILCVFSYLGLFGQQNINHKFQLSENTISNEYNFLYTFVLGGYGVTLDYEKLLSRQSNYNLYGKIGIGYGAIGGNDVGIAGIQLPLSLNILNGGGNNHFEVNLGARTFFDIPFDKVNSSTDHRVFIYPIVNLGYRYQQPNGKFLFKILGGTDGVSLGIGMTF